MMRFSVFALSAAILIGCDAGEIRSTGAIQSASTEEAANAELTCSLSSDACAKQARVKARSCLEISQKAVASGNASGSEARTNAQCAKDTFSSLIAEADPSTAADFAGELAALRMLRETASSTGSGRAANDTLAQSSTRFSSAFPGQEPGPFFGADAARYRAAFASSDTAACADLAQAEALLDIAASSQPTKDFEQVGRSIAPMADQVKKEADLKECV